MSLARATDPDGRPLHLPPGPVPCAELVPWVGCSFDLPCGDPWLMDPDGAEGEYLRAAAQAWEEHPDWMDFLDLSSPIADLKRAERDIYLHHWRPWLRPGRVLDVGCGIGRILTTFLDCGASVIGCDGDLESLRRALGHAAGRAGALDLVWTSATHLPDEARDLDVVVACEVLCYHPDPAPILADLRERLRPGGVLLLSWEAPFGWAAAEDAPTDSVHAALAGPGIVHIPGDRWVQTLDRAGLESLLVGAGFDVVALEPTHYATSGPLERCLPADVSLEQILALEAACRRHPVWAPLHRIWTATAARPG